MYKNGIAATPYKKEDFVKNERRRALHSATLRPLGEATAYAGSLAPALRGIDLPGRGRGSSERMEGTTEGSATDQGEDPPRGWEGDRH